MHHNNITTYILLALLTPIVCWPAASSSSAAPEQSNVRTLQQLCAESIKHSLLYDHTPDNADAVAKNFDQLSNPHLQNVLTNKIAIDTIDEALINFIGWQGREFMHGDLSDRTAKNYQNRSAAGLLNAAGTLLVVTRPGHLYNSRNIDIFNAEQPYQPKKTLYHAYAPCFSPDGKRLAYISHDNSILGDSSINITTVDEVNSFKSTVVIHAIPEDKEKAATLRWSPNSVWIMYQTTYDYTDECGVDRVGNLFTVWNTFSGLDCGLFRFPTGHIYFSRDNNDLLGIGTLINQGYRPWSIYKSYVDTLNTLAQLDQLGQLDPESRVYAELTKQYPGCANKALFPFLLTALKKSWRYNKPYIVMAEDKERREALCKVTQSMKNENLFEAESSVQKMVRLALNKFGTTQ